MAIASATLVAQPRKSVSAPLDLIEVTFAGDAAYPTGGTAAFKTSMRALVNRSIDLVAVFDAGLNGAYRCIYDRANDKLLVVVGTAGADAEVTATTDLSGTTFRLLLVCA